MMVVGETWNNLLLLDDLAFVIPIIIKLNKYTSQNYRRVNTRHLSGPTAVGIIVNMHELDN